MTCKEVYAQKPCLPQQAGGESHGYCAGCFPAAMEAVRREIAEMGLGPKTISLPAAESPPHAVDAQSVSGATRGSTDARTAHCPSGLAGQAVTPRGGAKSAISADPRKVPAVGVRLHFTTMNPIYLDTRPASPGLDAGRVARATGLSEAELYALHASDMVAPIHFLHQSGATGGLFYTVAGLSRLVEIFHSSHRKPQALVLRAELDYLRLPAPPPRAPAGVNLGGEWSPAWECIEERPGFFDEGVAA